MLKGSSMKKIPFFSLRLRLLLPVLIVIIPGLILSIYSLIGERQRQKADVLQSAIRLARIITVQEEDFIEATRELLISISHDPIVQKGNSTDCLKTLRLLQDQLGRYSNLVVTDYRGTITTSAIPLVETISIADRDFFQEAMQTGNFSIGSYHISRTTGKP